MSKEDEIFPWVAIGDLIPDVIDRMADAYLNPDYGMEGDEERSEAEEEAW